MPSLQAIVAEARRKGYFDKEDYPGLRLSMQELGELKGLLDRYNIPFGAPEATVDAWSHLTPREAKRIVHNLRQGIPDMEGVGHYSVGRDNLLRQIKDNLDTAANNRSQVQFLNADIGQGKTHTLYLLREFAFEHGFAVALVTLSENSCPLYDFMGVYSSIMWELRTIDQRQKPALSNIIDRWVEDIRVLSEPRVRQIVNHELPENLREIMAAYVAAINLFRPNETNRQLILKYLGGEKVSRPDLRRLDIRFRLNSENALHILGEMAATIRYIGFRGICILFDEAEAIHSFARSAHRDEAYANLQQIIQQSRQFSHCYFIYATTPSFFESHGGRHLAQGLGSDGILELQPLAIEERKEAGARIARIYEAATDWQAPESVLEAINRAAGLTAGQRVGHYIRQVIGILDEVRSGS